MIGLDFLKRDAEVYEDEYVESILEVTNSGRWVLGEQVKSFENYWASQVDTDFCIGVSNGLDALELGLRAIGIGEGDEVITTSMTAFATVLSIIKCGAVPVFVDIDKKTACITVETIEPAISKRTKAILVVHLYGRAACLDEIGQLCANHNLFLVEDCAQSHGSLFMDKPVGSYGIFSAWSFYPTKNLGTVGDAGAICTSSDMLAEKVRCLRNYGQSEQYQISLVGSNCRMDELHAAILRKRARHLEQWNNRRRHIASLYQKNLRLPSAVQMSWPESPEGHVYHQYVILHEERNRFIEDMSRCDIFINVHYPVPCHAQKAMRNVPFRVTGELINTCIHSNTCLSLPIHPLMTDEEVRIVIDCCNRFY